MLHFEWFASLCTFVRSLAIVGVIIASGMTSAVSQADEPHERVIDQLIGQLHQPGASIRAAAATCLAGHGKLGARATEALIECLHDTESDVRLAAAYALGCVQQDSARVLPALVPLLTDVDEHVRYSAEWSIARIAQELDDEPDEGLRGRLIAGFETALRHLNGREHQARHRVAMELALARLRHTMPAHGRAGPPPPVLPSPAAPPFLPTEIPTPRAAVPSSDSRDLIQRIPESPLSLDAALPTGDSPPLERAQTASGPIGGGAAPPSDGTLNPASKPSQPQESFPPGAAARATGGESRAVASTGAPQVVEVFYGTNRSRIASEAPHQELAASLLATGGGVLVAILLCCISFWRSGQRAFALVALLAIGAVVPFGYRAAQSYRHTLVRPAIVYGGDYRAAVELGICKVSLPPGHEPGALESPNLFKLEITADEQEHVVLTAVEELSQERFFEQLHARLAADGKNILVFIHGYNVSFEDAARRTAQMAADLKFPGAPVFYSWPSQANWYGYATDKENIELSVTQIKSFLLDLAAKSGATTINLVAHSMGNVGLTEALKEMGSTHPQPIFNQVVLAAPDIDADIFRNRVAPYIVTKAHHVTLYTSQTDLALIASRYFNSGPRLGDSGPGAVLFPGIDTIDATAVDTSLLGHSYYGSNVSVLTDLGRVLQNQPTASRQYLRTIIDAAQPYWAFDPLRISQNPGEGTPR